MRRLMVVAVAVAVTLALAGCTGGAAGKAQEPPVPRDDAVVVVGTASCDMENAAYSEKARAGGGTVITLVIGCTTQMSDPRLTGTETLTLTYRSHPAGDSFTFTADSVLTTTDGVWRGTGHGVGDEKGVAPFAEGVATFHYGEIDYVGEDAYSGLAYHGFAAGSAGGPTQPGVAYAGWIQEAD